MRKKDIFPEGIPKPTKCIEYACHIDKAIEEAFWEYLSKEKRSRVSLWTWDLKIPEEEQFGKSYFYRQFEFEVYEGAKSVKFNDEKEKYFQPYLELKDTEGTLFEMKWEQFRKKRNEVLEWGFCNSRCKYKKNWDKEYPGIKTECTEDFVGGLYASFLMELHRMRERPGHIEEKSILIHDLRFLGHPVVVELKYLNVRNPKERARLRDLECCYPGSAGNAVRYSRRLGERIVEALAHEMQENLVSEGSAVPIETIYHWKKRELRRARKILPEAIADYTKKHTGEFITLSINQTIEDVKSNRKEEYKIVYRKESGKPLRLIGVYRKRDWELIQKVLEGKTEVVNKLDNGQLVSPIRMFNLAIDYLTDQENDLLSKDGVSPVLGAMLFMVPCSGDRDSDIFEDGSKEGFFYSACWKKLLEICSKHHMKSVYAVAIGLPCLLNDGEESDMEFGTDLMDWKSYAEGLAKQCNVQIPRCNNEIVLSDEETTYLETTRNQAVQTTQVSFPTPSGVESFNEVVTRLLMFNPATLSDPYGSSPNKNLQTYRLTVTEDKRLDYRGVVPGIEVEELQNLLAQGFLKQERLTLFQRNVNIQSNAAQ